MRRYEHRVYAFASQFCANAADAREVAQDTFVKVAGNLHRFDPGREFAPWLFTIARRTWIDRRRSAPPEPAGKPLPEPADERHPGECLAEQDDRRQLWQLARRCLTDNQFQALWFRYAGEMEVPQIARVLGKTRVHVKVLLFRARQILGERLNPGTTLAAALPEARERNIAHARADALPPSPGVGGASANRLEACPTLSDAAANVEMNGCSLSRDALKRNTCKAPSANSSPLQIQELPPKSKSMVKML